MSYLLWVRGRNTKDGEIIVHVISCLKKNDKRLFFFHLRERYFNTIGSKPPGNLQVDRIFYLIGESTFPCPYIQDKLQSGFSEFTEEHLGGGFFEQVTGLLDHRMRNSKQELFYLSGIGPGGNGNRN
jgi:hypothetical protein